jgi:hypothetical protein
MIITIGFSAPKNKYKIFANAIQLVEKRPFSHVFTLYQDPTTGMDMIFQASHGMVNHISYEMFCKDNYVIKTYELLFTDKQFAGFYEFMLKNLGVPYGILEIVGIFFKKITHLQSPFHDGTETFICSELAARVCEMNGTTIPGDLDEITPSDLDKILGDINYGKT